MSIFVFFGWNLLLFQQIFKQMSCWIQFFFFFLKCIWMGITCHFCISPQHVSNSFLCIILILFFFCPSLIFFQAANGHEECVDALLHNGAEINAKDIKGRTPLHFASMCGHVGMLGTLLQVTYLRVFNICFLLMTDGSFTPFP